MNHAFTIIPLTIETKGEIITNNLGEFRELVREALANINRDLKTDEQFGQAELDVKALKAAEEAVRGAAAKSFDEKLDALLKELSETAEEIRVPRLELEKLIAKRKEDIKSEIVEEFLAAFDIDPMDARKQFLSGLQTQIKGKRTVESMRNACRIYQTTQQAMILRSRALIDQFVVKFGPDLVMDRRVLELKSDESVAAELVRRHQAKTADNEKKELQQQADSLKAEADKAKRELAESNKPPAPPTNIETGPWAGTPNIGHGASTSQGKAATSAPPAPAQASDEISPEAEWAAFKGVCLDAFKELKPFRERLRHPKNIAKAQAFADALNAAWQEANRKEAV